MLTSTINLPSFDVHVEMQDEGDIWIQAYFDEVDVKEQWTMLCLLMSEMREALNVELVETCVEHDCITARIKRP